MNGFPVLAMQDLGRHRVRLALAAGTGADWPASGIPQRAAALNRPLQAVVPAAPAAGPLGRRWSWLAAPSPLPAAALKPAEDGDGVVVRWMGGGSAPVPAEPLVADLAVDGLEAPAPATGAIASRRWRLAPPPPSPVRAEPVALAPDLVGVADGARPAEADLTGRGESYLAAVWPAVVRCDGVDFPLTAPAPGRPTLRRWRGTVDLPRPARAGEALWLLAAADGAVTAAATAGGIAHAVALPDWSRPLGRWWDPVVPGRPVFGQPPQPVSDARPGWEPSATARPAAVLPHTARWTGPAPLRQGHLALVRIPLAAGAARVELGPAPAWIAAAALVAAPPPVHPATTLRWP
jgi:hypothetical protein